MKGRHHVIVETQRLKYEFDIKRNITIIQGDSATGKTTLIDLLGTYGRFGNDSGIIVSSDVRCVVFSGDVSMWKVILDQYEDSIIFYDEDYSFIFSKDFADYVKSSNNYHVLITRQPLHNLPYSIQEIYGIRTSGKYHFPEKIYHEFYAIYKPDYNFSCIKPIVLVEDKKSGYQFYEKVCGSERCISAEGNSKIAANIEQLDNDHPALVIADGAAFGAYINNVMAVAKRRGNLQLFFPESFEWLILKSRVININNIDDILEHPENYIDGREFLSWERFFDDLLEKATVNDPIRRYDKSKLSSFYYEGKNKDQILSVFPEKVMKSLL